MIIIRSLFYQITIPSNEEYAIYANYYYTDGEPVQTEVEQAEDSEYGDIIIQTKSVKYILKEVYSAYKYAVSIMDFIKDHLKDNVIYIDLGELDENLKEHSGILEIEKL